MVLALLNKPTTPGTASHLLTSTLTCCIVHLSRSTLWQWMCYSSVYTLTDLLQFLVWLFRDWETPMCQEPSQAAFVCQPLCETKLKLSDSFILCTTPRVIRRAPSGLYRNSLWSLFRADMLEIETQLISSAPIKHSHFISAFWLHVAYFGFCLYYKTSPCKSKWMEPYVPIHTNVCNMYQYGGSGPLVGLLQVKENY